MCFSPTQGGAIGGPEQISPGLTEFAQSLVAGVRRNRAELDGLLARTADNWSLGRMAVTAPGVRPIMSLASRPTATILSLGMTETISSSAAKETTRYMAAQGEIV